MDGAVVVLVLIILIILILVACWSMKGTSCANPGPIKPCSPAFDRQLGIMYSEWLSHLFWTKIVVEKAKAGDHCLQASINRLLQNQVELGNNLAFFYGRGAGQTYTNLLTTHINQAITIVTMLLAGQDASSVITAWYQNANDIADFLASLNPLIDPVVMRQHMKEHLDSLIVQVAAILRGDCQGAIAAFDVGRAHIIDMTTYITTKIREQKC